MPTIAQLRTLESVGSVPNVGVTDIVTTGVPWRPAKVAARLTCT